MERITNITKLKQLSREGAEFFIRLNSCLISRKFIKWNKKDKNFFVKNYIDETIQILTGKDIFNKELTNIGEAIRKGSFFKK